MTGPYDDIIHLPHHVSPTRPQMSMLDRAAQFSPFAALTGYDAAIREAGRLTDIRTELTEDELETLDMKFQILMAHVSEEPKVSLTYFLKDSRKAGGAYITVSGTVKKLDSFERLIYLKDGTSVPMDDILDIAFDTAHP